MVHGSELEVGGLLSLLIRELLLGVKSRLPWLPKIASSDWIPVANTSVSEYVSII